MFTVERRSVHRAEIVPQNIGGEGVLYLIDGLATCQRPCVFCTGIFLDFNGGAARTAFGDIKWSIDGCIIAAIRRNCDKGGVADTSTASGCIRIGPSIDIVSTANTFICIWVSHQSPKVTHLFVIYAVTFPEVGGTAALLIHCGAPIVLDKKPKIVPRLIAILTSDIVYLGYEKDLTAEQ
jgi:hypothetical protein